jgi:hypothetical protein
MHEIFALLFSHKEEPRVKQNLFSMIPSPTPDRYGDTYRSRTGINAYTDDKMLELVIGSSEVTWGKNSAHVILKILSKLEMPWMEGPIRVLLLLLSLQFRTLNIKF